MIKEITTKILEIEDLDSGKLKHVPNSVIFASVLMSLNSILQGIADFCIEMLILSGSVPLKLPWRTEFFFLTFLSGLLAYHTLMGLRKQELQVTQDAVQVSLVVEAALIISDFYFLFSRPDLFPATLIRFPFLVLTSLNMCILFYIIIRLQLFEFKWLQRFVRKID